MPLLAVSLSFPLAAVSRRETHLVDSNWLAVKAHLVHDPRSVLGVLLAIEFDEAIALVCLRHSVFGEMHVDNPPCLQHELPDKMIAYSLTVGRSAWTC